MAKRSNSVHSPSRLPTVWRKIWPSANCLAQNLAARQNAAKIFWSAPKKLLENSFRLKMPRRFLAYLRVCCISNSFVDWAPDVPRTCPGRASDVPAPVRRENFGWTDPAGWAADVPRMCLRGRPRAQVGIRQQGVPYLHHRREIHIQKI